MSKLFMLKISTPRFLTRMGQPKILISSHFVHRDRHTDKRTHPRILISSHGDCPILVKKSVNDKMSEMSHRKLSLLDPETKKFHLCIEQSDYPIGFVALENKLKPGV